MHAHTAGTVADGAKRERVGDDEWEDSFVLEREAGEPNPDGTLAGPARLEHMPADLQDQLKALLKALPKTDGGVAPDKRRRQEAQQVILARAMDALEARYATTAAANELLLGRERLSRRSEMAVRVRLGEKRLLGEAKALLAGSAAEAAAAADGRTAPSKRARRGGD